MKNLVDFEFGGRPKSVRGLRASRPTGSIKDLQNYKSDGNKSEWDEDASKKKTGRIRFASSDTESTSSSDSSEGSDFDAESSAGDESKVGTNSTGKSTSTKAFSESSKGLSGKFHDPTTNSSTETSGKKTGKVQLSAAGDGTTSSSTKLGAKSTPSNSEASSDSTSTSKLGKTKPPKGYSKPTSSNSKASSEKTTSSKGLYKALNQSKDVSEKSGATGLHDKPKLQTSSPDPPKSSNGLKKSFEKTPNNGALYGASRDFVPFRKSSINTEKIRFLISGHIKEPPLAKPIFIIHQYNEKSPFQHEKPDFSQGKSEGNINVVIDGKFYEKSVLKEENNFPKSLNLKPEPITIDSRSKVLENEFSEVFRVGDHTIRFYGQFIKSTKSGMYTPFLGFHVQNLL